MKVIGTTFDIYTELTLSHQRAESPPFSWSVSSRNGYVNGGWAYDSSPEAMLGPILMDIPSVHKTVEFLKDTYGSVELYPRVQFQLDFHPDRKSCWVATWGDYPNGDQSRMGQEAWDVIGNALTLHRDVAKFISSCEMGHG